MSLNKDEALRAKDIAEDLMGKTDFTGARKLALRAQKLDSSLENISQMIMLCDVHCAATEKLTGNEMDWYGILQVEQNANDIMIKKQYKKLALVLHPDKNKLPGAESAFKLIGEAQRILLDKEKRMLHDVKRRTCRKPTQARAPAASYYTRPVSQTVDNMRNLFNGFRPENHHHQQKAQAQPATFVPSPSFCTSCPFCKVMYQYDWQHLNREMTCQNCRKHYIAYEVPFQDAPPAQSSCQATFCFPRQHKFPGQEAYCGGHKHPNNPATVSSRKNSSTMPTSAADNMSQDIFGKVGAENINGKRKRKMVVESSESSDSESADSESSSESEDIVIDENNDTSAAQDFGSTRGKQPRRSVRNKRHVIYNENLSDDDVDPVNHSEEESAENIDTERNEGTGDAKQSYEDHQSTETLRSGRNLKQKIKEDEVGSSDDDADDSEEDAASENHIQYDDPDFNDFDKLRKEDCFEAGQVWALYDTGEGMPRFYAIIRKVTTPVFKLKYQWLEAVEDEEIETRNLPVSVGQFVLGDEMNTNELNTFSQMILSKTKSRSQEFKVYPRKGETWALFKNWNTYLSSDSDSRRKYEYEFVEILSDHAEGATISVGLLLKVKGFTCVFCRMPKDGSNTFEIERHEFFRFSHRIPSKRLTGTEGRGVAKGWYELDPAALPQNIEEIVVPTSPELCGDKAAGSAQNHQSPPSAV